MWDGFSCSCTCPCPVEVNRGCADIAMLAVAEELQDLNLNMLSGR